MTSPPQPPPPSSSPALAFPVLAGADTRALQDPHRPLPLPPPHRQCRRHRPRLTVVGAALVGRCTAPSLPQQQQQHQQGHAPLPALLLLRAVSPGERAARAFFQLLSALLVVVVVATEAVVAAVETGAGGDAAPLPRPSATGFLLPRLEQPSIYTVSFAAASQLAAQDLFFSQAAAGRIPRPPQSDRFRPRALPRGRSPVSAEPFVVQGERVASQAPARKTPLPLRRDAAPVVVARPSAEHGLPSSAAAARRLHLRLLIALHLHQRKHNDEG